MKRKNVLVVGVLLFLIVGPAIVGAQGPCGKDAVKSAIDKAVEILEQEGTAGLEKVGEIHFCDGNYVFVNDLKGKTRMHINKKLIGKVLIGLKDDTGKRFFADFTEMAKTSQTTKNGITYFNGAGWVDYRWPKPGEKAFSAKTSYIRGCLMGDESIYVGAGIYLE